MGMYTELHYNAALREDVPPHVIRILEYMVDTDRRDANDLHLNLPDHPLFGSSRWDWMLLCDSYYFDADTHSTLRYDGIAKNYYLCIRCNLKNYENEIQHFIDWIDPYMDAEEGGFLGFHRYEEDNTPVLIFKKEGVSNA